MTQFKHDVILRVTKLFNFILITIPFYTCWTFYYEKYCWPDSFFYQGRIAIVLLFMLLYMVFARVYEATLVSIHRVSEMVFNQMLAFLITDGIMYLIICILQQKFAVLWPGLICIAGQILLSIFWCYSANKGYYLIFPPKRTAVIFELRENLADTIRHYRMNRKFRVCKTLRVNQCLENLSLLDDIEVVFLTGVHSHERNQVLKYCIQNGIDTYLIPRTGDVILSGASPMHLFHLPILRVGRAELHPEYRVIKRFFDILTAVLAIFLLWPVMAITAVLIKAYDGGPVLYKQTRLTKDREEFQILKFRSMRTDAEKDGIARLSTGDSDDRVTPIGRIIRKYRIDELPQIFNILEGSLSVVGPRPERPEIASEYEKDLPEFSLRLQVKAGLTGYAQVYGKYNTTAYDKLQFDLMYIANIGMIEDIRICLATVKALLQKESTEGIPQEHTNANK